MGFIDFLRGFFEESEEELLEDKKEAEKLKKEAEKKLKELRKRKRLRKKLKPMPTKYKVISVIMVITILALGYSAYKYKTTFHFRCKDIHPCKDCDAVILCPQFEEIEQSEHYLYFILENRKAEEGDCSAEITIEKQDLSLYNKTIKLGKVPASKQVRFKVPILLPTGNSVISINPGCEW